MLKRLIGLLGVLFLCGCASTPQTKETIRVACVGDSITFGAGIKDWPNDCYPKQLGNLLGKGYDVRNFGASGATMLNKGNKPYTKLQAYKDALAFNPDVVVIKLGTNDTKPNNWKFSDEYAADYVALIESFTDLKSEPEIFICKPVPVYKTRWGINDKTVVEEVIPKAEAVAKQVGAKVIDLYTALSNKEAVFPDKIHPNKDGAAIIAQTVYTALTGKNISKKETSLFPGAKKLFHGFEMYDNGATKVVVPKDIADGKPWILRARFWGHEPQFDIAMLNKGYHVVYCNVANLLGSPTAVKRWDDFYNYLRFEHLFNDRVILEGMSRGGLIVYNWAAVNPDKVAAIYADAPVMDFKSWPGGKGKGPGSKGTWKHCLAAYGFTEEQAMAYTKNPIDNLAPLAKAGIPIIHVVGDVDKVVPLAENTAIAQARYKKTRRDLQSDSQTGSWPPSAFSQGPEQDCRFCDQAQSK